MLLMCPLRKLPALDQVALSLDAGERLQVQLQKMRRTSAMRVGIKNVSQLLMQPYATAEDRK